MTTVRADRIRPAMREGSKARSGQITMRAA
jgi:hypothetical protein